MSVFDTSALLAILYDEAGKENAAKRLDGGVISLVNVAEVVGDLVLQGGDLVGATDIVAKFGLEWLEPTVEQTMRAAGMRVIMDLSLGDRFCIALAQARGDSIVTADRVWADHDFGVPVELIR